MSEQKGLRKEKGDEGGTEGEEGEECNGGKG